MKKPILFLWIIISAPIFGLDVEPALLQDTDPDALTNKIVEISSNYEKFNDGNERCLHAEADFHTVFDIVMESIIKILSDYDNGENVFPRMEEMKGLPPVPEYPGLERQWVHGTAKFLGIGADYKYTNVVSIDKNSDSEYVQHWRMIDCEEGNFREYEGFWYLMRLAPDNGRPRTYVRMYSETDFNDILPMQQTIMKMFTKSETEKVFKSVYNAASAR